MPQIQFNLSTYANEERGMRFWGPQDAIKTLAITVATSRQISTIDPPHMNSSYKLDFIAPGLRCLTHDSDFLKNSTTDFTFYQGVWNYIAWVPNEDLKGPLSPDLTPESQLKSLSFNVDDNSTDVAKLFIYVPADKVFECHLYNVSYTVLFDFEQGAQTLTSLSERLLNPVVYTDMHSLITMDQYIDYRPWAYFAISSAFNQLLIGTISDSSAGGEQTAGTSILNTALGDDGLILSVTGHGLPVTEDVRRLGALQIEELFRNITFSLFSMTPYL